MTPHLKMRLANKGKGEFRAEANTIWLYDAIAADDDEAMFMGGISPRQFMSVLSETDGPVTLRINSPGGSVFGAQAMVAAMRSHAHRITAQIDSLAASAASVIACAAAECVMAPGAMLMIHKAWGLTIGNSDDHAATAGLLDKIDGQIAETYARRAGEGDFLAMMADETWFTADEAVAAKLADRVLDVNTQRPKASWDLSVYAKAPKAVEHAADDEPFNDADETFAREMIPHHEMAISMAKEVISGGINRDLQAMAGKIIAAQTEEIDELTEWLSSHGQDDAQDDGAKMKSGPTIVGAEELRAMRERQLSVRLAQAEI